MSAWCTQAPATERWSHYAEAWMVEQFDAVVHLDKTSAVTALEGDPAGEWEEHAQDPPETFPFGV